MFNKLKIFIIEDEEFIVKYYTAALKDYEFCGYGSNLKDVLKKIRETRPNLIISDINLKNSELDGIDIVENIQLEFDIPIIFLSGYWNDKLLNRAKKIRNYIYLTKPVNLPTLKTAIESIIYQRETNKLFLDNIIEGYIYSKICCDENKKIKNLIVMSVNKKIEEILGFSQSEIIGKKISGFCQLKSCNSLCKIISQLSEISVDAINKKTEFEIFCDILNKWFYCIAYLPKPEYLILLLRDITLEKQKDIKLLEFYSILQEMPNPIMLINLDGIITFINKKYKQMSGYAFSEIVGKPISFFNAGFAAKNFYDNILEMVKLHGYWNGELCNRRANGELFWERATFSLIKDEHNNISEIIKTSEDITLYKLSEENYIKNIHATKNYIEKIVDAMADALIVITPKNKIKHINSALMKLVGYSQNELLGENVNKIFLDLEINDNLKKSIKVAKISELKTILKSKANELIPVSVNFSFLQYEDDYDNFDIIFLCRDIREQIRTHEIIELSEKRFEIAIKTGNMAFYEYTLYNSKIEWSNSIDSLLKYDVGEFPRTLDEKFKIIYPEDLEFIKQKFERHLYENCEYENVEYRIYNKNNELRWWLESIYTVRDIENQPVKVIGIIHDITNRKETELKLSKSLNELENIHKALLEKDAKLEEINNLLLKQKEEIDYRFNTLAQNLDIGLFRVNLADRKLVYFNQGFLNIFGYSAEEIVNIDRDNFYFNSNDRIKLVEDLKKNGIVKDRIIEFKQKGGKKIIGQTTLKLNDNEPNFFDGIIYDITEKFELIKRLDETLDRYAALFENVNIGLLLLSTNGIIIDANDYVINLFQLKKSDIYGIFFNDLIKYESEKINFEELENAEKKIYENIIVEVNDNLINLQIELKRIIIAEVVFLLMTIKDITELIKLEQEKNNNQIMLIQSSKLAALGELAAGIAHEINQPLAGISMGLENLINKAKLKQINEDYVENKCKTLLSYIDRIKHIIQHIRIYSREQSTQMDKKFNILSPILNSLSMVGTQYINHNILIERDFDETAEIFIIGNEFKLEQVILNLLSNARDAVEDKFEKLKSSGQLGSYRKKIKISVYTKNDDVYLSIEDNGCGIKKENIEKIFNAFFTTKPEGKGTGLGLAIVQSIVKEMNAILLVDSCENEWTRFTIQIKISR